MKNEMTVSWRPSKWWCFIPAAFLGDRL